MAASTRLRLDGEARRDRIVAAAMPLFARKGFVGTTTKEIAEVAGVSEALLFKHFPSKAALYGEILDRNCRLKDETLARLDALTPSTRTLVQMTYAMVWHIVLGETGDTTDTRHRLILNSLLADGDYARLVFETIFGQVFPKFGASLEAAAKAGDLVEMPLVLENRFWFAQHLATMLAYVRLAGRPAVPYGGAPEELVPGAVWFALRGMGLVDRAIAEHFNREGLAEFARTIAPLESERSRQ